MTNDDVKRAWRMRTPVEYQGATYTISALIYRLPQNLTVELYDKCGHAVLIVTPEKIYEKGDDVND